MSQKESDRNTWPGGAGGNTFGHQKYLILAPMDHIWEPIGSTLAPQGHIWEPKSDAKAVAATTLK